MKILFLGPDCPSIESFLRQHHVVIRTEQKIHEQWLRDNDFDFAISYRYTHIIREPEIAFFGGRLINLHISLLPWNRGADPNIWSYLENTPRGVSIHQIDKGLDTGPLLLQKTVDIDIHSATLQSSWEELNLEIQNLFLQHAFSLFSGSLPCYSPDCEGSIHRIVDKEPFAYLWQDKGWQTPVAELLGKAL